MHASFNILGNHKLWKVLFLSVWSTEWKVYTTLHIITFYILSNIYILRPVLLLHYSFMTAVCIVLTGEWGISNARCTQSRDSSWWVSQCYVYILVFNLHHHLQLLINSPQQAVIIKSVAKLKTIFGDGLVKLLPALITTWLQCQRDVSYMRCPYMQDFLTIELFTLKSLFSFLIYWIE